MTEQKADPVSPAQALDQLIAEWRARANEWHIIWSKLGEDGTDDLMAAGAYRKAADELEAVVERLRSPSRVTPLDQALEALAFAHGAISDAVGLEEGLDGIAGEKVMAMINTALTANGRQPLSVPPEDHAVESSPYWTASPSRVTPEPLKPWVDETECGTLREGEDCMLGTKCGQASTFTRQSDGRTCCDFCHRPWAAAASRATVIPPKLADWWAWCNAHPHALDTVAKQPAAVIEFLWAEVQRLRVTPTQETQGIPREGFREAIDTVTQLARSEMRRFHGADSRRGSFEDCRSPSCAAIKLLDIWLADEAASRVTPTPDARCQCGHTFDEHAPSSPCFQCVACENFSPSAPKATP